MTGVKFVGILINIHYIWMSQMQIESRKELSELPKTVHGGQGWKIEGTEDYSQNLNPFGPPPSLEKVLSGAVSGSGHYPDADCTEVRTVIGKIYGLGPECVTMGAGSSEIIRNFPNVFIRPGDSVLIPTPSFAEYTQQCKIAGASIDFFPLLPEDDYRIDEEGLFKCLSSKTYKILYICNPNNPTGRIENRDKLEKIIRKCEETGTLVFLDETLLELVKGEQSISLSREVCKFSNLLVAHSFTKSFAIPGIRVGFALSNPGIVEEMEKVKLPWNIGTIEQAAALHLIQNELGYVDEAADVMCRESDRMFAQLKEMGFPISSISDSFFYFMDIGSIGLTGSEFKDLMLKEGIMVRDCASFGPQYKSCVRFCVKDKERNDRFLSAVRKVLGALR